VDFRTKLFRCVRSICDRRPPRQVALSCVLADHQVAAVMHFAATSLVGRPRLILARAEDVAKGEAPPLREANECGFEPPESTNRTIERGDEVFTLHVCDKRAADVRPDFSSQSARQVAHADCS
jgi:hypothetical protein